jgi:RES domain-containing protein
MSFTRVFRIASAKYAQDISGEGASLYGGRWNPLDYKALYCSNHISLAALEIIVHGDDTVFQRDFNLLAIDFPKDLPTQYIKANSLKKNWSFDMKHTQRIGQDFLTSKLLVLYVPSVVIPQEFNLLLNPYHKDFSKVTIASFDPFSFDERLK